MIRLDLLVRGRPRSRPNAPDIWLAVEASAVLNRSDVEQAQRRAAALRSAGFLAIPREGHFYPEKEVTVYYKVTGEGMVLLTVKARYGAAFPRRG